MPRSLPHPAQPINDELPLRPVDTKDLKYKCSKTGRVTTHKTVYARMKIGSESTWNAVWWDGEKQVRKGGFSTDLAAARHAAEMNVDAARGPPLTEAERNAMSFTAPYDADIYVS
jgi:hypothetical protein